MSLKETVSPSQPDGEIHVHKLHVMIEPLATNIPFPSAVKEPDGDASRQCFVSSLSSLLPSWRDVTKRFRDQGNATCIPRS